MKRENGFTVIELLVVLTIVAIVGCIVAPSFDILEKISLKNAANELKMNIIHTQHQAIKNNKRYFIKFLNENNVYTISHGLLDSIDKKIQLHSDIKMGQMAFTYPKQIIFTPKGTVASSGHIWLETEKFKVKITVAVGTGKVNIYPIETIKE
ncbi:prepilin-type N-terminal cleavage/methylation domain-containing protein [Defluviitalea phaphyphila]|uniref:prepilin-type N-terminal cleavage/methylation domain-containing protein n=1 Tax=Defluviitalea phaphyphila TaxID=1473580 RepID=UPI000730CF2F|nr:prepilin-type N-terminal cleavage/methylation domain-containing protein [Defluviitalea phaphyphila]